MNAQKIIEKLSKLKLKLTLAESLTGGWIAKSITDVPGASKVFEYGYITYSDVSKNEMLGVPLDIIKKYGTVSEETVATMAQNAKNKSHADIALAVSGLAGNETPAQTHAFLALCANNSTQVQEIKYFGSRNQ
ncbi:MAG: CinA family protein, partial [Deltaproteobacteria bacterium]|nr:CinA family protein [Deltaproteobacteria bacterium]